MNANGRPPSYNTATRQPPSDTNAAPHRGALNKAFQVTGILHIVAGGLCIVMGIAAIVFKANLSYIAFPVWGGLLIFITTGIIGCAYYCKPKSKCIVISYLVMSTLSGIFAGGMFITYIVISSNEDGYHYYGSYECYPLYYVYCDIPLWPRLLMDILLCLVFFLEMACGCTSMGTAIYKACKCCRSCCACKCCKLEDASNNQAYYSVPMMAVAADSTSRPVYIAGGSSRPTAQPTQMMFVTPSPQAQSYLAVQPGSHQVQHTQAQAQPAQFQAQPVQFQAQAQSGQVQAQPQQIQAQPPQIQAQPPQIQAQPQQVQVQPQQVQTQPPQVRAQPIQVYGHTIQVPPQPVAQIQTQPAQVQAQSFVQVQGQHFIQAPVQAQASHPGLAQAQGGVVIAAASPMYPAPTLTPGSQPPVQQQPPQQGSAQDQTTQQDKGEEATETMEVASGEVSTGQFSDKAALI